MKSLACPHCGNTDTSKMVWCQDTREYRNIEQTKTGSYRIVWTGDSSDGENPRLHCDACDESFEMPREITFEYD